MDSGSESDGGCTLTHSTTAAGVHADAAVAQLLQAAAWGEPPPRDSGAVLCHVCGADVPLGEWDSHEAAHALAEAEPAPAVRGDGCRICGAAVPPADMASHLLAHRLEDEERRQQRRAEHDAFVRLREQFGFAKGPAEEASSSAAPPVPCAPAASYPEDTECRVQGLLPLLASNLMAEAVEASRRGVRTRAVLSGDVDFYFSRHDPGNSPAPAESACARDGAPRADFGWGCGYRNIQMLCSHLLRRSPALRKRLFEGAEYVPTVPGIQAQIERSWALGFDPAGRLQLGGRLRGTRKWIGTSECCALLRGAGLPARIVGFKARPGPQSHRCLMDWVWRYFTADAQSAGSAVDRLFDAVQSVGGPAEAFRRYSSGRPPLYFQHEGHSRCIVGVVRQFAGEREAGAQLLVFDPSCHGPALRQALLRGRDWQRRVKRGLHTLRQAKFELLWIEGDGAAEGAASPSKDIYSNVQLHEDGELRSAAPASDARSCNS